MSAVVRSSGPASCVPSTSVPLASITESPSRSRQAPIALKFSSAKPTGSITLWHDAQLGVLAMILETLAHRGGDDLRAVAINIGFHARRRRRHQRGQQILEYPATANHRRRPACGRRDRENAALAEQAAAMPIPVAASLFRKCEPRTPGMP